MRRVLYQIFRRQIFRAWILRAWLVCAALLGALAARAQDAQSLLADSLTPQGRAELERNDAPIAALPTSYVEARLDPDEARLAGHLRLVFSNRERRPLSDLVLRLYPNAFRKGALRVEQVEVDGKPARFKARGTVLTIAAPLAPGASCAVTLEFKGSLHRLAGGEDDPLVAMSQALAQMAPGLSRRASPDGGYGTFAVGPGGAVLVDWYPQLAARAHGDWDRAEINATGDAAHADPGNAIVSLTVPRGWHVEGAGSALGQHALGETEQAAFAASGIRGGLGLVASPDYALETAQLHGVSVRAASLHGPAGTKALFDCAAAALGSLQARFGPYPWRSLTIAEAELVGGAGGVELPALSLVSQALASGGAGPSGMFDFTCYHEVAHQWWQALVGSDPRRAPWLDEALAQYSAALVVEDSRGKDAAREALATYVALNYQGMRMANLPDGVVARPAADFKSPMAYAGLIYGKAPLFFREARIAMGDEAFNAACRAYRQRWAFREAGPSAWTDAALLQGFDLRSLQQRWWHERHGDEDIPPPDAASLFGALGAGGGGLSQLLQGLQNQGGPSEAEMKKALEQLKKLMPELQKLIPDDDGDQ